MSLNTTGEYVELAHEEQPGFRTWFYIAFALCCFWLLVLLAADFMHRQSANAHGAGSAKHSKVQKSDSHGGH